MHRRRLKRPLGTWLLALTSLLLLAGCASSPRPEPLMLGTDLPSRPAFSERITEFRPWAPPRPHLETPE